LNWKFFIAKRFITKEQQRKSKNVFLLSILSVALSVAVMNISLATLKGFSDEIRQKIRDIHGDFIIDSGENIEEGDPILIDNQTVESLNAINNITGVDKVVKSSAKACILKSEEEMEGLIAKGVSHKSITDVLKNFGTNTIPQNEKNWCVISKTTAKSLGVLSRNQSLEKPQHTYKPNKSKGQNSSRHSWLCEPFFHFAFWLFDDPSLEIEQVLSRIVWRQTNGPDQVVLLTNHLFKCLL
jgi:ABC-type lipoprotein release transport system permease subunit